MERKAGVVAAPFRNWPSPRHLPGPSAKPSPDFQLRTAETFSSRCLRVIFLTLEYPEAWEMVEMCEAIVPLALQSHFHLTQA